MKGFLPFMTKKKEDFSSYSDYQYPLRVYLAFMPLKLFYHFIIKLFYHFIITFPMIKKRRSSYRSISFSLLIPLVSSPLNSSTLISLYSHQVILIFIEIKFAIPPDYKNIHVFQTVLEIQTINVLQSGNYFCALCCSTTIHYIKYET